MKDFKGDKIYKWYKILEDYRKSGKSRKQYCEERRLDINKFCNYFYRLYYKKYSNPKLYSKILPIGREYLTSGMPMKEFLQYYPEMDSVTLSNLGTHIRYIDNLEAYIKEKGDKVRDVPIPEPQPVPASDSNVMEFVRVQSLMPPKLPEPIPEPAPEVIAKKNDIEIQIAQGVKVIIAPNIDSTKTIKIIDLLKDL